MMRPLAIIVLVIALAALAGYLFYQYYGDDSPLISQENSEDNNGDNNDGLDLNIGGSVGVGSKTVEVKMTAAGFSPATVNIKSGDTVRFVNSDTKNHWPASGVHPTHQICPGFDAKEAVGPGESISFKFTEKKECPMHDHLNPALKGKIIVE